ncbi:MAG: hypothetical protein ABR991_04630 [Terracidiphilus sp.]|jgi:hypothetical protein
MMSWKKILFNFLLFAIIVFAVRLLEVLNKKTPDLSSHSVLMNVFDVIATAMFMAGSLGMNRDGYRKFYKYFGKALLISILILLITLGFALIGKATVSDRVFDYESYFVLLLFSSPFYFALYLNRKQNKSTSQQESANES